MRSFTSSDQPRDRLIRDHSDAARRIALRMARRCPDWIAREDIVAAGMLGLIEAAARYDDSRQEPFLAFAEHRIRGAILDELRRGDIMPRRVRQLARKISAAIRELEKDGEKPSDQRIADALGVSLDDYRTGLAELVHVEVGPIDNESVHLVSMSVAPDVEAGHRMTLGRVRDALALMEQRDVTILGLHYVEDLTYQEIAETLRITPSRVCQLLWRAVERLRAHLGAEQVVETEEGRMNIRVLIADDDPMIRRTLASALGRVGFDVSTAADGGSALRLAEIATPDITVLDLNMPLGGIDVVRELKAIHGADMFVAVLTGEDCDETRETCLAAGADAVLLKPLSVIELRKRLLAAASGLHLKSAA